MNTYQFLKQHSRDNPGFSIFLSLVLYLIGTVVLLPLAGMIIAWTHGISLNQVFEIIGGDFSIHPKADYIFRYIQGINQLVTWGFVGLVMTHLLGTFSQLLKPPVPTTALILAVLLLIISLPLVQLFHIDLSGLGTWGESIMAQEKSSQKTLTGLILTDSTTEIIFNLFIFAFLPAICEELFFRGFLQNQLYKWGNHHLAVWLGALIFSFVHFQLPGLFSRMVLAVLLGYFFYSTKNLLPCILAHFFYNAVSILFTYVSENKMEPGDQMTGNFLIISIISLILTSLLAYWYVKKYTITQPLSDSPHE